MAGLSSPPSTPRSRWRAGWWHVVFLVLDLPVGLVAVGVAVLVVTGVSTLPLAFVGALILVPTLWFAELFGWAERIRLEAFLGIRIEAPAAVTHPTSWRRLLLDRTRWRATAYASICALWATFIGAVVMSVLGACLPLLATPFLPSMAPPGGIRILPWLTVPLGTGTWLLAATAGLVLAVAPLVAGRLTCVDVALARWLLGPDTRDQIAALATRVDTLTEDRAATVDSVEEERRRIERDLHDGPQQRLVSIAMDLGMAREWLDEDPARARVLLDSAHSASKEAITEIRNVARGIAPPVLTDRGLDAAISALAARTSVPVTVDIEGVGRLDPTTEAIAYFCVSECLTNVVKHADAAAVTVRLRQQGADLVVRVWDNGRGGADPAGGTGLTGLRQRVRAVDGSLTVDSPPGGPTVVTASLPHRTRRPSCSSTTVVIAEDSVLLREGLIRLLHEGGFVVSAACGDAESFLTAVDQHRPDLVVIDVRMPPTFTSEGIRAALVVREMHPSTAVVVLSQYVEEEYAAELVASRPRGVGYLLKDRVADTREFLDAVRSVAAGATMLDPEVVTQLLIRSRHKDPLARLTPREREVLALMAQGRANAGIAAALVVTEGAVEKHVSSIFAKLDLAPTDGDHRRVLAVLQYLRNDS